MTTSGWLHAATRSASVVTWSVALERLSGSIAESSPADQRSGEVEKSLMDVGTAFPTNGQAPVLVQQGQCLLDDPAAGGHFVA
ncbi:hypothetical protein ACLQ3L_23890, partial [Nocardia salmonicida]